MLDPGAGTVPVLGLILVPVPGEVLGAVCRFAAGGVVPLPGIGEAPEFA
jgi:hypothetical protein